ncbi:RNA polymerase sigma-70 factor [Flavisolibacter sp. BT320]|nr:RNA polymerase sigma-70 factor [Flavisolibacter longurius]
MLTTDSRYVSLSDAELFRMTQKENDAHAYEVIYYRYWPKLMDAAYKRLSSRQKAEDIVQELFINFYQRRTQIEITNSIQSYLNQALKYRILNEYRSANTHHAYIQFFLNTVCKNDLAIPLETKELVQKVEQVLAALPEKCRQVYVLSRKENLSNKEIGERLHISVSTVEKHIVKALKALRHSINAYQAC